MVIKNAFYNKKVLITGHTGFKGSWLTAWLKHLGAKITGISLEPPSIPSHFEAAKLNLDINDLRIDLRDKLAIEQAICEFQPDFLFHLAAQPLVRLSYDNPIETWEINVLGTLHVLEALRKLNTKTSAVIITSDKCYDNVEWEWGYRETDALGGPDPYSASKGAAELAIKSHIKSYFPKGSTSVRIASARAGNVIGGGDWAVDRIVPDCVKAWSNGGSVKLRNPHSTRPWQHVLEPLGGYLNLAVSLSENLHLHSEPFNFGPSSRENQSVLELVKTMAVYWDQVQWDDVLNPLDEPYESGLLKLNCDKALHHLNWSAVMDFKDTVRMTSEWYKVYYQDPDKISDLTNSQIIEYEAMAKDKGLRWVL